MNLRPYLPSGLAAALLAALPVATIPGRAQSSADGSKDEPVRLSVFQVQSSRDYGYRATNSITATGIGTEIYQTPISVSVVTRDLINDLGANSVLQSLQYTAAVATDSRDPSNMTARGFIVPTLVNRQRGSTVRSPNSDFIERIEVVKGPNAVFFGRVAPGGVVNLITLQPKSRDETVVRVQYGSYDLKSAFLDYNKVLTDTLEVRVAGTWYDRSDGFIDWTFSRSLSGYAAATWRPTPRVVVKYNTYYTDGKEVVTHSSPRANPDFIRNGRPGETAAQYRTRMGLPATTPLYTVYAFDLASDRGRRFNNNGPESFKLDRATYQQLEAVAEAADWLTLRAAGNYTSVARELMEISGFPAIGGTYVNQRGAYNEQQPRSASGELEAIAQFKLGPTSHRLLVGGRLEQNRTRTASITPDVTNFNYFRDGVRRLRASFPASLVPAAYGRSRGSEEAIYAVDQIGLLDDRVKILAGVRKTWATSKVLTGGAAELVADEVTPQFGLFWEPVKGVALFANYAKTFEPQFQVDAFGKLATNVSGEGKEAGFKTDLLDGRLSGSVSVFEVLRSGEIRRDPILELSLGVSPIFFPGGSNRSRGAETEFIWTPVRNYQAVFGYTYLWEAETIQDTNVLFIGARLFDAPEHQMALWNRYTFTDGALKGVFVGAGLRYRTKTRPVVLPPDFDIWDPSYVVIDALVGWDGKWRSRPLRVQVNLRNLANREYFDGAYTPANPLTASLSVETRF